jgi:hypothetical protein
MIIVNFWSEFGADVPLLRCFFDNKIDETLCKFL